MKKIWNRIEKFLVTIGYLLTFEYSGTYKDPNLKWYKCALSAEYKYADYPKKKEVGRRIFLLTIGLIISALFVYSLVIILIA